MCYRYLSAFNKPILTKGPEPEYAEEEDVCGPEEDGDRVEAVDCRRQIEGLKTKIRDTL